MNAPAEADYLFQNEVSLKLHEQTRVEIFMDGQASLMVDEPTWFRIGEPAELYGQSRGWTPVHLQHAGLISCTAITVTIVANDRKFGLDSLAMSMRSEIDARGFLSDFDRQPEFTWIELDFVIRTAESPEAIAALAHDVDRRCPQMGLFHRAKIPMRQRWFVDGSDAPCLELRYHMQDG